MPADLRKARDLVLLDAIDTFPREEVDAVVWRVCREGRDPLQGARSTSRWCNDTFDVLYTASARDGAIAEVYALLSSQPVFPSKLRVFAHQISARPRQALRLPDLATLTRLGVDTARYRERIYNRTQEIADAAFFLGFDALIAPSARWTCDVFVLFTDRIAPDNLVLERTERTPIDWAKWRNAHRRS